jgi:hypothetical protein
MSCKLFALLGAAAIWSGTATAGAPPAAAVLPHYDVQAHCKKIARFGSASYDMLKTCIDQEQDAKKNTKGFKY